MILPMRVTFLGTADGFTRIGREHSGILIEAEQSLLLDCGANAAQYFLQRKLDPDIPSAIWISHLHSDHVGQFASLIQSLWLRRRRAPLQVFAPAKAVPVMRDWLEKCLLFPGLIGFPIKWQAISPRRDVKTGPFTLSAFPTRHLAGLAENFQKKYPRTSFDCYGVAITHRDRRYVYSADLEHPRDLRPALRSPVRALFCELTHFPEEELFRNLASHQVESLWITHYPDRLRKKKERLIRLARREGYLGAVHLVHDKKAKEF